ncbi:MAG TPA: class I SAM-dependent methyltransferase [Cyanobacteria bacterium UBA12227]|nr:class I SAM-dependent methyltransferase [Cyanobacteria bacterium UBA12227]HAX87930.1 class I SAM-dependent methyltransferase [Cyanobacteria bacterium UBA11370]HBY80816.1 class I SAM-dependent methyltransferase [Cyanobacteria bacterium UBA11148]
MESYKEDLAYIHDVGYSDYALKSAPGILEILNRSKIHQGLVVDLGCGSGLLAQELVKAGYHVLGIDISESMIAIARARVLNAEFRIESLFKTNIPPCNAVISIGECFNYLFDSDSNSTSLLELFRRIYNALTPRGVLIFDIVEPGQIPPGTITKGFTEGDDWVVLVEKEEDREQEVLTRRIITFRKIGDYYRRDEELHRQRLYKAKDIAIELRQIGFRVQVMRRYGEYNLPKARAAFIARKLK